MKNFVLAIDQGTTGSTALIYNIKKKEFVATSNHEFPQIFPKPRWVEHNLIDIWQSIQKSIEKALSNSKISADQIACIGITNQRETTCAFRKNGVPLANAIVWQDRRTESFCDELINDDKEKFIKEKTGLPIDAYFSGSKMHWLLNNNLDVQKALKEDDLWLGTIDAWIVAQLTNYKSFCTDASNASRTMMMDLKTATWDKRLLDIFGVDEKCLPEIKDSASYFGITSGNSFLPDGIPITGILGDQQAALFGQQAFKPGEGKCTFGTGAFYLVNTGSEIKYSDAGLVSTCAYRLNGQNYYALEGSCYIAGAAIQWLRDNLNLITTSPESEELASKVENLEEMKNVLFFPFFTGIGSPYWKSEAQATITGLSRDTNKNHITRAALEGVALSIRDLANAFKKDFPKLAPNLFVDGGMVNNKLFLEILSNFTQFEIVKPKVIETTALGASYAALLGANIFTIDDLTSQKEIDFKTSPSKNSYYSDKSKIWDKSIKNLYL